MKLQSTNNTSVKKEELKNIESVYAFDRFSLYDNTINKPSHAIMQNRDVNQNIKIPKGIDQQMKKDQIDFSGLEEWNFQNKDNKSGTNKNINNYDDDSKLRNSVIYKNDVFNFDDPYQRSSNIKLSKIGADSVIDSELTDPLKINSHQELYNVKSPTQEDFHEKPMKKSSGLDKLDVSNLGKEYDNSSPVISKGNLMNDFNHPEKIEINIEENRKPSLMDQNRGIDFDNILSLVELKDNTNRTDINYTNVKKFPNENYDAYFNNNNNPSNIKNPKNDMFLDYNFYHQDQGNSSMIPDSQRNLFEDDSKNLNANSFGKQFKMTQAIEWDTAYGKSMIGIEKTEEISRRKTNILNDDIFYVTRNERNFVIEKSKSLKPRINYDEEALNIQIQDIFNEMLIKTENPEKVKLDLQNVNLDESIHASPIGFLFNLDRSLSNTISTKMDIKKEIGGSRIILNDGNGFYRTFMFALLESRIISSDLYELRKLIFDLNTKIEKSMKRKDVKIDKDRINLIFSLIIDALENRKIREAYDILIKAYLIFQEFDYALIKYMRLSIAQFLDENKSQIFNMDTLGYIAKIVPEIYISKVNFDLKSYLEDNITCMHFEVQKIVFLVTPIIFNINLELYFLEGIAHPSIKEQKFFKNSFPCLIASSNRLNHFTPTISLFYRFCRFEKFYTNNYLMQNRSVISFSEFDTQIQFKNVKQRITILAEIFCEVCNRQSQLITISHMPGMCLCKLCLVDFVHKISKKRVRNLSGELYLNKECKFLINLFL